MAAIRKKPIHPVTRDLVLKAGKDDDTQVACFDQSGKLVGICRASDITPVSNTDGSTDAPQQQATPKAAPAPAPAAAPEAAVTKARAEALQLKKALYGNGLASDADRVAAQMGAAAAQVLREIHKRPRGR